MKRVIIAGLLATVATASFAQYDEETYSGWGIRAGLDINIPGDWKFNNGNDNVKMFSSGAGFTAGVVYNKPVWGNFYIEPGLAMFYDTYKVSDLTMGVDGNSSPVTIDPKVSKFGLRLPVMAGYTFTAGDRFCIQVFTGPELRYAFVGKLGLKAEWNLGENVSDNIFDYGYRRFDCAWKLGVGFPMGRWYVSVDGAFGLLDLHKNDISFRENRATVSLGYDF